MRVLLINTPALFERPVSRSMAGGLGFDANADMVLPPLDLAYLAAYLRAGGHEVGLFDADGLTCDRAATLRKVEESPCDVLICSASLPTLYADCAFLREVRQRHRGPIYAKTNVPDRVVLREMLERSGADGVIYGEPEVSICGIVEGTTTDNLVCVREGEIVFGERRSVEDVDQLLMPARELLPNERYTYPLLGQGLVTVQSSRGCPFPCGYYCPYPLVEGKKWRARSPRHVVDELEEIIRIHNIGKVLFRDATFTLDKNRAAAICDEILARGLNLSWWCETRVDRLDRPLLEKLRAAGCLGINIGVETGDEEVMVGQAKRGLSVEKLIQLRNDAKEVGLALHFLMLVGFPDETRRSILASYDLIQDLQPESLGITLITPYPGTPLHQEATKRGWIEPGSTWSDYGGHQPVMHTDHLTAEELVHGLEALHRGFRLLKMRGKVDDAALQQAMDEDYMRLQAWASQERENPFKLYARPEVSPQKNKDEQDKRDSLFAISSPQSNEPAISVIIPTCNRRDDLLRCLKALATQTFPAPAFEVIVCDDGSADGTREMFESGEREKGKGERGVPLSLGPFAFRLKYLRQENRGPAAARNAGIRAASGQIILFLGDDIAADARLLERHAAAHRSGPQELALLGHTAWPPDLPVNELMRYITDVTPLQFGFHQISDRQNVPFGFFYTSNVSVNRVFLMGSDLFDEGFPYAAFEDIELEYRLRQRGLRMVYDPEAIGYHYHPTDLERFSQRQYRAGRSAIYFHRKHPDPALDAEVLLVSRMLKETLSPPEEIERLRSAAAEVEKLDLSKFSAIAVGGRSLEAQLRDILYEFYARVLQASYAKGVQDAAVDLGSRIADCRMSSTKTQNPKSKIQNPKSVAVSIIIPVFNNLAYTRQCLETVFAHSGDVPYEVIVVDNASTDETRAYLEGLGDRVRPIFNDYNAGFARANNQANAEARGRYLLYLNNDTEARPLWLSEMVRLMESDDRIGILGSKLLYPDGKVQHAGLALRVACLPGHLYWGADLANHPIVNRVREVQAVTGACLMLRRGIVDEPAVFDEQFINGSEDVDLCLRVRERGYRVVYCPTSVLVHHESKTPGRKTHDERNYRLLKERWEGRVQADFDQILMQDGFVRDPNGTRWTWDPARMQPPQPPPPLSPAQQARPLMSVDTPVFKGTEDSRRCLPALLWHGPIYDPSGYADEARNFILGLQAQGFDLAARPLGRRSEKFYARLDPQTRGRLDRALARQPGPRFINVVHFPAYAFQRVPQAAYNIGRAMFETDGLPAEWVARCDEMDEVWVPTDFNLRTFRDAGVTTKLVKVPGGMDTEQFRPGCDPLPISGARGTVFLSIFEWIYRKGWDVLLRAWAGAFRPADGVSLVLRTYPLNVTDGSDNRLEIERRIDQFLRQELGLRRDEVAPILVLAEQVPEEDLPRLYAAVDAYVAPSRGEGWGRPQMQAMACGLPVIATRWSGNLEFMDDENSLLIDMEGLAEIDERAEIPFYRGQRWAEPSADHLTALLRRVHERPPEVAEIGLRARQDIVERWRWEKVAGIAAERLRTIRAGLDAPPSPARPTGPVAVRWEGSQFVVHSLALVNRELCVRLSQNENIDLSILPYEAHEFEPDADPRFEPIVRRLNRALSRPADVHVRHQWPPHFTPPAEGRWVIIQPWEFGRLPKAWVRPMAEEVDEIWVPSAFVRQCYIDSGVPAGKVFVVPNGVNPDLFRPGVEPMDLPTNGSFRFLFVGGAIYRKGIDALLDAYAKTFRRSDDVCLVIKDMGQATFYKGQSAAERIRALACDPDAPEILYLTDPLPDPEVPRLYAACHCLVHPYRGEGFGLPVAEAMACGLPVIVTRGGACDDFCTDETACFIPAQRVDIAFKEETAGQAWLLEPDREALSARMRWVVEHPDRARAMGVRASAFIRTHVTWERAASAVVERLTALRAKPALRKKESPAVEVTAVLIRSDAERTRAAQEALERSCGLPCEVVPFDGATPGLMKFLSERWATFRGRAVAVLSDGVLLTPGALERMVTTLDTDASVAMVTPSSNVGTGAQAVKPRYRSLKKELEKFARKVAHDRRGLVADVPWPDAPCAMVRREPFAFPAALRTDAGLMALARALRRAGRRVVCCREAYVHVEPAALDDAARQREAEAVRHLESAEVAGDVTGAVEAARRAVEALPLWAQAHNDLGRHLYRSGDAAQARAAFERAARIEPEFVEAHSNLGVLLWETGEQEEALRAFDRAAQIDPENVDLLYNLGSIYAQTGDAQQAAAFFERCLTLRPDDPDIRAQLASLRAAREEIQTAD